mgnify:CR=1 FL=1
MAGAGCPFFPLIHPGRGAPAVTAFAGNRGWRVDNQVYYILLIASWAAALPGRREIAQRRAMAAAVRIKRIYEPASPEDGARLLVDRVWPRGITKGGGCVDDVDQGGRAEHRLAQMVSVTIPRAGRNSTVATSTSSRPTRPRSIAFETTSKPVARPCSTLHMIPRTATPSRSRGLSAQAAREPSCPVNRHPRAPLAPGGNGAPLIPAARVLSMRLTLHSDYAPAPDDAAGDEADHRHTIEEVARRYGISATI